jgi:hypothetical protein
LVIFGVYAYLLEGNGYEPAIMDVHSQVHRPEAASGAVSSFWPTTSGKLANMVTSPGNAGYGDAVVEE